MATTPTVNGLQTMQVEVNGPGSANTLIITSGIAVTDLWVGSGTKTETYELHVEPQLSTAQFKRATGYVALADMGLADYLPDGDSHRWAIEDVSADYDDQVAKVRLRFNVELGMSGAGSLRLNTVTFSIHTLAEI